MGVMRKVWIHCGCDNGVHARLPCGCNQTAPNQTTSPKPSLNASPAGGAAVVLCQPGRQAGRVEHVLAVRRVARQDLHLVAHS